MSWCIVIPSSGISAIFCTGSAYLVKAATVVVEKRAWRMLGIIDILCRGVLHFLVLGFRPKISVSMTADRATRENSPPTPWHTRRTEYSRNPKINPKPQAPKP